MLIALKKNKSKGYTIILISSLRSPSHIPWSATTISDEMETLKLLFSFSIIVFNVKLLVILFIIKILIQTNAFKKVCRSSHPEVFLEKGVLKICSKFTGEHPWTFNFIEIALRHGCSTVYLLHIFRTSFPKNTSEGLLLSIATPHLKELFSGY